MEPEERVSLDLVQVRSERVDWIYPNGASRGDTKRSGDFLMCK